MRRLPHLLRSALPFGVRLAFGVLLLLPLAACGVGDDEPEVTIEGVDPVQTDADMAPDSYVQPEGDMAPDAPLAPEDELQPADSLQPDLDGTIE